MECRSIPAHHLAARRGGEGEEAHSGTVILEVTEVSRETIEIAFNDERNIRRWLRFDPKLLFSILHEWGRKDS